MTKRKEQRRELLKEDELLSGMEKVAQYIQDEPKKVFGITAAILIALAAIFGFGAWQRHQEINAAGDLYRAEEILSTNIEEPDAKHSFLTEKEKLEAALVELDKVIDGHSGPVKRQAVVYKVRCLTGLGRQDEVEPLFQELAGDSGLRYFGIKGLADFYAAREKYDEAIAQYQILADENAFSPELIQFHIAECYKNKGEVAEAKRVLEEIVETYKDDDAKPPVHFRVEQMLTELEEGSETQAEG